ncbi:MAG: hypothetical protein WCK74_13760 [Gemmatimonadaceae bacterium]
MSTSPSRLPILSLLPVRDPTERVVSYLVSVFPAKNEAGESDMEAVARGALEASPALSRQVGLPVLVPITPALLRDGSVTRFASVNATWIVPGESLADSATLQAVERLRNIGIDVAFAGFPPSLEQIPGRARTKTMIVLDAGQTPAQRLHQQVCALMDGGFRILVRQVDDRATRQRVIDSGPVYYAGRPLLRRVRPVDSANLEQAALTALRVLATYADGRPPDSAFGDALVRDSALSAALMKAILTSIPRAPKTLPLSLQILGRETVLGLLVPVTAQLLGEFAQDPEVAFAALRCARTIDRLATALTEPMHPRMRVVAGLLAVAQSALGLPMDQLADALDLSRPLRDALGDRALPLGELLDLVDAFEYGWWDDLAARCEALNITPQVVSGTWHFAWRAVKDELKSITP